MPNKELYLYIHPETNPEKIPSRNAVFVKKLSKNISYFFLYPFTKENEIKDKEIINTYLFKDYTYKINKLIIKTKDKIQELTIDVSESDLNYIVTGKYSKTSIEFKNSLIAYYKKNKSHQEFLHIQYILNPVKSDFENLSKYLNVKESLIESINEIFPIMNYEQEIFKNE